MSEENIKYLTVGEISNYIATMNKLVEEGIIKFNKEKAYAEICIDEATTYLEKQNVQLQQENKQLKEEVKDEEQWRIKIAKERDELHKECLNHIKQRDLYKSVIEEVREYIESKNNGVCVVNGEEKPAYTFLLDFREAREFVWELLQILDKVKENK